MIAPLTPPECDVRSLPFMPLEPRRLLDSDLFLLSSGSEFKGAVALWCWSWTQVPAASIPDEERVHAKVAGMSLVEWREVAEMALRGWSLCDDGRLYHPVVAEKALRGWIERIGMKERSAKGNATRYETFNYTPEAFAALKADAVRHLARLIPSAQAEFGIVLQGEPMPPVRSGTGSRKESAKEPISSQHNGTERNRTEGNGTEVRSSVVSAAPKPTPDLLAALTLFNQTAEELGLPTARKLSEARRKKLISTLSEHGPDGWAEAMQRLRESPHCRGQNDRSWKADLDFLLTPSKFLRLIEGAYAGLDNSNGQRGRVPTRSYLDVAMDAAA